MKKVRFVLWAGVAITLAVYLALSFGHRTDRDGSGEISGNVAPSFQPAFALTNHRGRTVTERTYRGKWLLVFFGFTNCPDICPTTLAELASVMDGLEDKADSVTPMFISIDPARDRVEGLSEYVSAFHPAIVGLTGGDAQIADAARAFMAYYEKQPQESAPDGYTMGHTSAVYLISPQGAFIRTYSFDTPPVEIVKDLRERM